MRVPNSTPDVVVIILNGGTFLRVDPARKSDKPRPVAMCFRWLFALLLAFSASGGSALPQEPAASPDAAAGFLELLRRGFALDHRLDQPAVLHEIDRVRRSPSYLARLSPRIERYLPAICAEALDRGIPGEICLLPIIESGVNPAAVSGSGARGLWQLVPGTAKRYGLKITWTLDERRDPIASTDAALRYLNDLQRRFSDWTLALAAYNCGETRVANTLASAAAGASFFELRWPTETAVYVPRLLAFAAIFADPSAHGITLPDRLRRNAASTSPDIASGAAIPVVHIRAAVTSGPAQGRVVSRPASSLKEPNTEPIAR